MTCDGDVDAAGAVRSGGGRVATQAGFGGKLGCNTVLPFAPSSPSVAAGRSPTIVGCRSLLLPSDAGVLAPVLDDPSSLLPPRLVSGLASSALLGLRRDAASSLTGAEETAETLPIEWVVDWLNRRRLGGPLLPAVAPRVPLDALEASDSDEPDRKLAPPVETTDENGVGGPTTDPPGVTTAPSGKRMR